MDDIENGKPKSEELTKKQELVYNAICAYVKKHSNTPTIRELQEMLNYKSNFGVWEILKRLEAKGYIVWENGKARGFKLKKTSNLKPSLRSLLDFAEYKFYPSDPLILKRDVAILLVGTNEIIEKLAPLGLPVVKLDGGLSGRVVGVFSPSHRARENG